MSEVVERHLHFTVSGKFITNAAREKLFVEKDLGAALRILRSCTESDQLDSDEQLMLCLHILHGSASIVGNSGDDSYGIETRDDLDEHPTDLSSIATLISDMAAELKALERKNSDLQNKISFLASEINDYKLQRINVDYYNETGEPMFSDIAIPAWAMAENQLSGMNMSNMLDSFLEQCKREHKAAENGEEICDYGWLEPNGTWHPVEWGDHSKWAMDWLEEHMPFKEHPEIYWYTNNEGDRHHIYDTDVLVYSLNWILLDSPHHGLAKVTRNPAKNMTKAQKEFLYDYFNERNRHDEANALYEE